MKFIVQKPSEDDEKLIYVWFPESELHIKVIKRNPSFEHFEKDIKRRIDYIFTNYYERSMRRLRDDWESKLKEMGITEMPENNEEFAKLVFSKTDDIEN